jgi:hypothetical protein
MAISIFAIHKFTIPTLNYYLCYAYFNNYSYQKQKYETQ